MPGHRKYLVNSYGGDFTIVIMIGKMSWTTHANVFTDFSNVIL